MKIQIYSGGANGADHLLCKNLNDKFEIHHLYTHLKKSPYGTECITQEQFNEALKFIPIVGNTLSRKSYQSNIKYFARDYWIAKNADLLIAVGYKKENSDLWLGGTSWTIEFGKLLNKKIIAFDQTDGEMYQYNIDWKPLWLDKSFNNGEVQSIGLCGSRELNNIGLLCINNIVSMLNDLKYEK
jgi:hypothetical protein